MEQERGTSSDKGSASKSKKSKPSDKKREALLAKQAARKFKGATAPDPALGVSLEEFTAFTEYLKSSKRILALLGAGLSASSGVATFRGADRLWRGYEPSDLSDNEAFFKDPVLVWWIFTDRMAKSQRASPNAGHHALTKLAESNSEFFAINQNIDGTYWTA